MIETVKKQAEQDAVAGSLYLLVLPVHLKL